MGTNMKIIYEDNNVMKGPFTIATGGEALYVKIKCNNKPFFAFRCLQLILDIHQPKKEIVKLFLLARDCFLKHSDFFGALDFFVVDDTQVLFVGAKLLPLNSVALHYLRKLLFL